MSNINLDSCYKTSNNKHFGCPPRMADGRHFTDYRPNCYVNNLLRANNNINNSFLYRKYLTENADRLMQLNRAYACQKNCCGPCVKPYNQGIMLPLHSKLSCDENNCQSNIVDQEGLGQGIDYGVNNGTNNVGGCNNWQDSLPIDQPYNCCSDNKGLFNYYDDIDTKAQGNFSRHSIPSGGIVMSGGDPKAYNH